jgi:hypothetical protein
MVWAADPHAVARLIDQSDYGISCVCAGAAGALFATTSHHRSQALRLLYPALLVGWLVAVSATSGGLALFEHPIAFVLGWAVAIRRPWSVNARRFGRKAVLVLTLALALFVGVSAPAGAAASALGGTMADSSYSSAALKGTIHFEIYLPPRLRHVRQTLPRHLLSPRASRRRNGLSADHRGRSGSRGLGTRRS